jgi:hypothetical protein
MNTRMWTATLVAIGALSIGAPAAPRDVPIEHFTAKSAALSSPARLTLRPVDIVISRWSTYTDHRALATALLEKGHVAFLNLLCGFGAVGSINVFGGPDIPIRYAWSIDDRDGGRRIYLATDEPVSLTGALLRRFPDEEPLTFIELRINRNGDGEGKLSEAARLSVDESRNVIELRDYTTRPLHLLMVRSERPFDE